MLELRADSDICKTCTSCAACYNGTDKVAGCPMFAFPRTMDDSTVCTLCASCITSCPNDAIEVRLRKPTSELWFIRKPQIEQSLLAMAIMEVVLIQNVTMLELRNGVLDWVPATTGAASYTAIFTIAFVAAVSLPVGLLALPWRFAAAGNLEKVWRNFASFGYALIPLDIAGHLAHNLFHLLAEGKSVWLTALPIAGAKVADGSSPALLGSGTVQLLQYRVPRARHRRVALHRAPDRSQPLPNHEAPASHPPALRHGHRQSAYSTSSCSPCRWRTGRDHGATWMARLRTSAVLRPAHRRHRSSRLLMRLRAVPVWPAQLEGRRPAAAAVAGCA